VNDRSPIINNETYVIRHHGQFDLLRLMRVLTTLANNCNCSDATSRLKEST
jgi:hypothetical protein